MESSMPLISEWFVLAFQRRGGIQDDVAVVGDQHRQFLQRRDARIILVGRARRDGGRNELDLVDQSKLDRRDAHLAGERRGGRESEFHLGIRQINRLVRHCEELLRRGNPDCRCGTISGLLRVARNDGSADS
jgi:hypothetical protein